MPPVQLDDAGLNALSALVLKLTPQNEAGLLSAPDYVAQGALIYQTSHCDACHQIASAGKKVGPPLDGVGQHRDRAWLEKHFQDPKSTSPGSIMPPYKFTPPEMDAICKYLLQLPKAGG
jgi:mono/diheme cytochrome c family protein